MEYIAFGEVLFEEHSSSFSSPYLFNGKELDRETNLSYFGARYYDGKTSLWLNVDPMMENGLNISPYVYCFNNPLMFSDPSGLWPVYNEKGEYIGDDGRSSKGKDLAFTGEKDGNGGFKNLKQFTDKHTEFQKASNVIKKESSGDEIESLWIAHTANNAQKNKSVNWKKSKNKDVFEQLMDQDYSTTPSSARKPLSTKDNSSGAMNARAGLINVLSGGTDPTGGADLWDGFDFLHNGFSSNKFKEYGYVRIDSKHLKTVTEFYSWQSNKDKINGNWALNCMFEIHGKIPHVYTFNISYWTGLGKESKSYQGIRSNGAYGGTIFWNIYKR